MAGSTNVAAVPATALAIFCWYSSNIGVLILNKFLLSSTGFNFPVFLTLCHMLACAGIGLLASMTRFLPLKPVKSWAQMGKVVLLSSVFCMTVVFGNASLKYMPVSFNQAVGATTPFFTAILAFLVQGQREAPLTYYTLIPIMLGVVVASGGEPLFHVLGVTFCLLATALRALKSVVQSILMSDPSEKMDPMSLLLYMSVISVVLLLPATMLLEPSSFLAARQLAVTKPSFSYWLLGNSCLAYLVNLTNFLVTKYTSALTLQVLGNAKGVVAAVVSVLVFRNVVTAQGALGYAITVAGVFLYSESKRRFKLANAKAALVEEARSPEREPLVTANVGSPAGMTASTISATISSSMPHFRGPERA